VRVIAATNRNLEACTREKQFREDLYYRLSVVNIQPPALRETTEDIPILANHFLQKHCAMRSVEPKQFTSGVLDRLSAYHWPGNSRQLENEVKRLVASVRSKIITEDQIAIQPEAKPVQTRVELPAASLGSGKSLFAAVEALERQMIQDALKQSGGNKLRAAQILGLSRQGFLKKLKKLDASAA